MKKKYCSYLYWILQIKAIEVSYYFYQTMQEDINITYKYCQNATVSLLYGFRSIYKTETKKKKPKHSRQNNFLATCSHQRQAALRADNKKQIQKRLWWNLCLYNSHWARWTLKHRWSLQLLNGFPPPNSGWIYRMVYIKLIKSKSSVSGAVMHWGI